jgi:fatty acid desaturase
VSTVGVQSHVPTPEERARKRARYFTGLLWHAGAFLIINAFFWILDLTLGAGGLQWAFWITGVWGFALAFHVLAYSVEGRGIEERAYGRYLEAEGRGAARRE